eukprot:scaffold65774_cov61-Phaeocystis_antarctica.AAC.3
MFAGAPITEYYILKNHIIPSFPPQTSRPVRAARLVVMFSDLDGLAVQRIVRFLEVSELARTSCANHELSTLCAEETEARARARIKLSWHGISGLSNEEACNALKPRFNRGYFDADGQSVYAPRAREPLPEGCRRDIAIRSYPTSDLLAIAAQYAGGWGPLLAGRDGVDVSVQQAAAAGPVPTADDCLVLWEIVVNGEVKAVWTGVVPLLDEMGSSDRDATDRYGNPTQTSLCNLVPFDSPGTQGKPPWWDTRKQVGVGYEPTDCVISTSLDELVATGVRHRISLLAPGGERPVYQSLELSRYFQPVFDAIAEIPDFWALASEGAWYDAIMQKLDNAFNNFHEAADPGGPGGGVAAGYVWCGFQEARNAEGNRIPSVFDFELQDNFFLFGHNISVELDARINWPTLAVRYNIVISLEDGMWQRVLDNCNPTDGEPWPSSEDDDPTQAEDLDENDED